VKINWMGKKMWTGLNGFTLQLGLGQVTIDAPVKV